MDKEKEKTPAKSLAYNEYDAFLEIARAVAKRWPTFSAYVLAPAVVLACLALIIKHQRFFFFFASEGSAAGLIVPIVLWAIVIFGFIMAGTLFLGGIGRLEDIRNGKDIDAEESPLHLSGIAALAIIVGGFYLFLSALEFAFELLVSLLK